MWALIGGGSPTPTLENPNAPGDIEAFDPNELTLIIEEGRRQLDHQAARFTDVQARAQTLLTVALIVLGFNTSVYPRLTDAPSGWSHTAAVLAWFISFGLVICGLLLAAAVVTVRAVFDAIDTTQITTFAQPLDCAVAKDYAFAVRRGEETVADRVNAFQIATRYAVWGAIITAVTFLLTA